MAKERFPEQPKLDRALENIRAQIENLQVSDLLDVLSGSTSDRDVLLNLHGKWSGQNEGAIDHHTLTNYDIDEHRPLNDDIITATNLWSAEKIRAEIEERAWTCPESSTVNQVVYAEDDTTVAIASHSDEPFSPPLGVIETKFSSTSCELQRYGQRTGFLGITPDASYFLDTDGGISDSAPATGNVYRVGIGVNSTTIRLLFDDIFIQRT